MNLSLKPSKCFVGYTNLVFLGFHLGHEDVTMVNKIKLASPPTTKKQLRSFFGLVTYYPSFIPNFTAISVPLTDLTRECSPNQLVWQNVHDHACQTLKSYVCHSPVLRLPDMSRPFILQTDVSCAGIGAILLQEYDQLHMLVRSCYPVSVTTLLLSVRH